MNSLGGLHGLSADIILEHLLKSRDEHIRKPMMSDFLL